MDTRRITTWIAIALGACVVLTFCALMFLAGMGYARPLTVLCLAKWRSRKCPVAWVVPQALPAASGNVSGGREFSYYGYQFHSPWADLKRERKLDAATVLNFSNGAVIAILETDTNNDFLGVMKAQAAKSRLDIKDVFGEKATRSNYDLRAYALNLTPRDLRWFSARQEMVGNSTLFNLKCITGDSFKNGLYLFQSKWLRGIQEGNPEKDKVVILQFFDANDRSFRAWVGEQSNTIHVTQADVSQVIYSMRPESSAVK